jgi:hypothetical protein
MGLDQGGAEAQMKLRIHTRWLLIGCAVAGSVNAADAITFSGSPISSEILMEVKEPTELSILGKDGSPLVVISLKDGTVRVLRAGHETEAARQFWKAVHATFPKTCK